MHLYLFILFKSSFLAIWYKKSPGFLILTKWEKYFLDAGKHAHEESFLDDSLCEFLFSKQSSHKKLNLVKRSA